MPVDRETGRPRGFAFVEFAERTVAEQVIDKFNAQPFQGRNLAVSEARAREDRPPGFRPPGGGFGGPRPGGGGFGTRAPGEGGTGPGRGGRDFGPPAPPKGKGPKKAYQQKERAPKGPIPTKFTGRMYDLDDIEKDDDVKDELPEFMKPEAPAAEADTEPVEKPEENENEE